MIGPVMITAAFLLDVVIGDPPKLPHPVVMIGKLISVLEKVLYTPGKRGGLAGGALMAVVVVASTYFVTAWLLYGLQWIHPWLSVAAEIWLLSAAFSVRGLAQAAGEVLPPLQLGDLNRARQMVGRIVGRQTRIMDDREVVRATVETVAENIIDGFIAPLFYAFIGGAPLAMAYKAVNTLDSMVGYKNERYNEYGLFSARLDDAANYLPARLGGMIMVLTAWIGGWNAVGAWKTLIRDARKHPSPNSGIPEAVMAGALGVRLGGVNQYEGRKSFRGYMGDNLFPLTPVHVQQAVRFLYVSSALAVLAGCFLWALIANLLVF